MAAAARLIRSQQGVEIRRPLRDEPPEQGQVLFRAYEIRGGRGWHCVAPGWAGIALTEEEMLARAYRQAGRVPCGVCQQHIHWRIPPDVPPPGAWGHVLVGLDDLHGAGPAAGFVIDQRGVVVP